MDPIKSWDNGILYVFAQAIHVNYRRWAGIGSVTRDGLLAHANYAADPDLSWITYSFFESPAKFRDNCGTEKDGWFVPNADTAVTTTNAHCDSDHIFQLAAGHYSYLLFGVDEASAMVAGPIASVPGWTGVHQ